MLLPHRSYLYVPGVDTRRMGKALGSAADALVLDLEDSVPPDQLIQARSNIAAFLSDVPSKPTYVRLSQDWQADIAEIAGPHLSGVRIPKCESPLYIQRIANALRLVNADIAVEVLLESALGIELAFTLAKADPQVSRLVLGEADLRADLRVSSEDGMEYSRSRAVAAARAARLAGPIQSVFVDVHDLVSLRESTKHGRSIGFWGRSAVTPAQAEVINDVFTPTPDEIERAKRLLEGLDATREAGRGVMVGADGRFVDEAVARSARWTLEIAASVDPGV